MNLDWLSMAKNYYDAEVEENNEIHRRLTLLYFMIALGTGFLSFLFSQYDWSQETILTYILGSLLLLSFTGIATSVSSLLFISFGMKYRQLPKSSEIYNYYQKLKAYYSNSDKENAVQNAEKALSEFLIQTYQETADQNKQMNSKKNKLKRLAHISIIISFLLSFLMIVIQFISYFV